MPELADGKNQESVLCTSTRAEELMHDAGGSLWLAVVGLQRPSRMACVIKSNLSPVKVWKMRVLRDWTAPKAKDGYFTCT